MGKNSLYQDLRDKWIQRQKDIEYHLWSKHGDVIDEFVNNTRNFAVGSLSGLMLLSSPAVSLIAPPNSLAVNENKLPLSKDMFLAADLQSALPDEVRELTPEEEQQLSNVFERAFGVKATAEYEGMRLNRSYGLIGAEQHLMRYPGDTMASHFATQEESQKYYSSGMAPGRGAWGYFAPSVSQMTEEDVNREKYYIAVQTFLAPGFSENVREYVNFFKYRKMLVVNPQNGHAMVVVIADAGPAAWTGKHLGGSPEVMKYLERVDGRQRGPVIYFFLDDPENKIPLGPIEPKE